MLPGSREDLFAGIRLASRMYSVRYCLAFFLKCKEPATVSYSHAQAVLIIMQI